MMISLGFLFFRGSKNQQLEPLDFARGEKREQQTCA
jgi:hypothetical protein